MLIWLTPFLLGSLWYPCVVVCYLNSGFIQHLAIIWYLLLVLGWLLVSIFERFIGVDCDIFNFIYVG
jgi:hypothetical protein